MWIVLDGGMTERRRGPYLSPWKAPEVTRHQHADASRHCARAKPNRLLRSSAEAGWTSLLIDHHEGVGRSDAFETHPTGDVTLVVALRGSHRIEVLKRGQWQAAVYQPGAAGLTPPHEATRLRWASLSPRRPFETAHAYLPGSLFDEVAEEYRRVGARRSRPDLSALVFQDQAVAAGVAAVLGALRAEAPDLYAEHAARWLAAHLLSRHAGWWEAGHDPRAPAIIADGRLARVVEYMTVNIGRTMPLGDLAREAGISVHHFGRRFREQTGLTPHAYLVSLRMTAARRLLRTTHLSVAEIATACGYARPAAFSAAFRRQVGQTPQAYRRSGP